MFMTDEEKAKKIIEENLPNLCKIGTYIVVDDLNDSNNKSPDLQNSNDDIGIEVTRGNKQEDFKFNNVMCARTKDGKTHKYSDEDFLKLNHSLQVPKIIHGCRVSYPNRLCDTEVLEYAQFKEPIKNRLIDKLRKLNTTKNRKYFSTNGLFIFVSMMNLNNIERISDLYNFLISEQSLYKSKNLNNEIFDFIIIFATEEQHTLCYFDMQNDKENIIKTIKYERKET